MSSLCSSMLTNEVRCCAVRPIMAFYSLLSLCSSEQLIHRFALVIPLISFLLIPSFPTFAHSSPFTMNPHRARKPVDEFDDTPIKYPSQLPPKSDGKNPHVIIVGAGLAGLFLAILLDKAGIPYKIYERAASVKPLGMMSGNERQVYCEIPFL